MKQQIGEKLGDLSDLPGYEAYLNPGDKVELRIYSDGIPEDRLEVIKNELNMDIVQESRILSIQFNNKPGSLSTIANVVGPALSNIQGWQLFKETSWVGVAIVGLIAGLFLLGRRKYVMG